MTREYALSPVADRHYGNGHDERTRDEIDQRILEQFLA
jgi:hypothetical protein